ncbi:hypothetical protein HIM_00728 [Hirsutella minnesotensis 3608]|nr:hypothetical protein HIM_00728 [Hirsutella minnesotensis 3608]
MKAAVASLLVAGLAQVSHQTTLAAQDRSSVTGEPLSAALQKFGIPVPPKIIKLAECSAPCLVEAAKMIPCSGKPLITAACINSDKIKEKSQTCIRKCGVPQVVIDFVGKASNQICRKFILNNNDNYE